MMFLIIDYQSITKTVRFKKGFSLAICEMTKWMDYFKAEMLRTGAVKSLDEFDWIIDGSLPESAEEVPEFEPSQIEETLSEEALQNIVYAEVLNKCTKTKIGHAEIEYITEYLTLDGILKRCDYVIFNSIEHDNHVQGHFAIIEDTAYITLAAEWNPLIDSTASGLSGEEFSDLQVPAKNAIDRLISKYVEFVQRK